MLNLAVHFLAVFGLTNAIVFLHIGSPIRKILSGISDETFERLSRTPGGLTGARQVLFARLIRCHACAGFWVSLGIDVGIATALDTVAYGPEEIVTSFITALASSAFNFAVWVALRKLGAEEL